MMREAPAIDPQARFAEREGPVRLLTTGKRALEIRGLDLA
jgi:hypothetical protein